MSFLDDILGQTPSDIYDAVTNIDISGSIDKIMNGISNTSVGDITDLITSVVSQPSQGAPAPAVSASVPKPATPVISKTGNLFNFDTKTIMIAGAAALVLFLLVRGGK